MALGIKFVATAPIFTFTPTGSTVPTDLAPWTKDLSMPQSMDSADGTGYTNTNRQYFKTIQDLSMTWTTFLETGNVIEDLLIPGAAGTVIFGPSGSTAGNRKYSLLGFISDFSIDYPYSDMATAGTTFMPSGNLSRGVYP
jgi:hypothetical protein